MSLDCSSNHRRLVAASNFLAPRDQSLKPVKDCDTLPRAPDLGLS